MENEKKIGELLGMKQEDMAMLLQVHRSQWSMYESYKRDLPGAAKLQLAEMLSFLKATTIEPAESFVDLEREKVLTAKLFKYLKLFNQHQLYLTEKKIQAIEKKYKAGITALQLIRFLENKNSILATEQKTLLDILKNRAEIKVRKSGLHIQAKLQFKLKVLMEEERLLNEMIAD